MSDVFNSCPNCRSENLYPDGNLRICPDCNSEFDEKMFVSLATQNQETRNIIRDALGNQLSDGDSVIIIKDLKVKGSSFSVKVGTKVKKIRLIDEADGHNISCKIDGFGAMNLKSEFVKKA